MPALPLRFNDRSITLTCASLLLALLALLARPAEAQMVGPAALSVPATLEAETLRPAAGTTVTLALAFRPRPGWHGYWTNPGEAGLPMALSWSLPSGVSVGTPRLPVPDLLRIGGLANHVFERAYAALVPLTIPGSLPAGTEVPIAVDARWLACTDEICVPQSDRLRLTLTVGRGTIETVERARFDRWRAALPRPLTADATWSRQRDEIAVAIPLPRDIALAEPHLFADRTDVLDAGAEQLLRRTPDRLIVTTKAGPAASGPFQAVLRLGPGRGLSLTAVSGPVPAGGAPVREREAPSAWLAFLLALAGGVLLNVMPCVFPILSLKALALARSGGDRARGEAVAYAVGAVAVSLGLGGVLLLLRAGGAQVGWAFQLQDPRTLALLFFVTLGIAANLAGLFEVPAITGGGRVAEREGLAGSLATGALAAFVATPCTGPFMAAAVGAALVLPAASALAIFGGLGLGLALPFLALGFLPAVRKRLPRPGPWMETLKRGLAVPMALTAAALAWVVWRQAGWAGLILMAGTGLVVLAVLAIVGHRQRQGRAGVAAALATITVALAAAFVLPVVARPPESRTAAALDARPFNEARFAAARATGRPVFAYFTADWCLTCKVNEATAINTAATRRAFRQAGVVVLEGDWTDGDPELGRTIERYGRAGVPLYLWASSGGRVELLPQVLSSARLIRQAEESARPISSPG